ncbi:UDP-glycosyltransferase 83A1 isoform X2 [Sorghum bicolor]|uniref:Glycosyltransferase n=1 Tax=Sorghum bicolor TaxID=4558 RepID=C5Y6P7_SORBI|nr:UDP-glycosyltransferase 83A1 isoform X2 [Sorghum bicolor]EES09464.1 hypothetical protein SORBI_3005G071300 [Sorghum bicolor]|eukprot:XP_002450476.1 UDP-glycosyltransferase 83A1 isoform X2 [Sorghum bicolor]
MPSSTHALFIAYPAQGHVLPLLELAHRFADHGFAVTFVNTDHIHGQLVAASPELEAAGQQDDGAPPPESGQVRFVSVSDGIPPDVDRNNLGTLTSALMSSLPPAVEHMIQNGNFRCMVVDYAVAWVLGVAKKSGMRTATLWPSCAAVMAAALHLPELIADGILDKDGLPTSKQIPPVGELQMNLAPLAWNAAGTEDAQRQIFRCLSNSLKALGQGTVDLLLCNTVKELEEGVLSEHPRPSILPIGPLPTGLRAGKPVGNFWVEDDTCLSWLDEQPDKSVVYVAFGSMAVLDQNQFHELAHGLELSGRHFLWVVRPGLANAVDFPDGFLESVEKRGKIVTWSPQHSVLAHPAIACFVSHCGWNSVMEGVRNGLPFLTWPYFCDQFINESYVCDVWKTGLRLVKDAAGGVVTREHIAARIEKLLNDSATVSRASELQQVASRSIGKDGTSFNNLTDVINAMKG